MHTCVSSAATSQCTRRQLVGRAKREGMTSAHIGGGGRPRGASPNGTPASTEPSDLELHAGALKHCNVDAVPPLPPAALRPHHLHHTQRKHRPHHLEEASHRLRSRLEVLSLAGSGDMKFSHSIQFNAVPDWQTHYIAYSNLKKLIYTLEKSVHQGSQLLQNDGESSPLLEAARDDPDKVFRQALVKELDKIDAFYRIKEREVFEEVDALLKDDADFDGDYTFADEEAASPSTRRRSSALKDWGFSRKRAGSNARPGLDRIDSEDSDEGDQDSPLQRTKTNESGSGSGRRRTSVFIDENGDVLSYSQQAAALLKKRMVSMYVTLTELKSYVQLNKTGFTKVLKKYDKTLDKELKNVFIAEHISNSYVFRQGTLDGITDRIAQIEQTYANAYTQGNVDFAKRELRLDMREHVVWERNTVWREMIGIERKAQAANLGVRQTLLGDSQDSRNGQGDANGKQKQIDTFLGRCGMPSFLANASFYVLIAEIVVFVLLLTIPIMDLPEQQNCLAMVIFVSLMWATEAIPLFVTSLLVPFLVVVLRIVRTDQKPHARLESKAAASYIFAAMWTPVIMLLLGGFTIAAALSKHNIAKMMATFVLSKAGTRPRNVLLTSMFVAMFASMWISNVAAPVLCFSIIQPILRNLPPTSDMTKALLLGIALSANIGGAASPIASPQNLIALQNMAPEPGWGTWFFISLPVCIISILLIWLLLLVTLRPGRNTTIVPIRPMKDRFTGTQWFITAVTIVTIALWCASHQLEPVFGDMGVVAIIPMALFFGTGILTKEDFNNFLWTIIILAAGGLALGKAVNSSGLLHAIAGAITQRVESLSLFGVLLVFSGLVLVVATFISHTVAALIILPLVRQVGEGMAEPHPNLLVMASVLMCSAAMGLPTSGFPNMTAIMMEDSQTGQRYLRVKDFVSRGVPASVLTWAVVISVGYGLMRVAGL
ncbi:hypothetical protein FH972_023378 [Carpinus fangiana]|uniref:SPX domain-containing protein n=1 Tax=Carpinus fangiana TaxID=176857 RepID=A0A5N6KVI1_9ROSI|nr:hypothetical protein FH972_023378 [Carpinus fangiana]